MAALHNPSVSFLNVFLPVARASLLQPARTHPLLEQLQRRANKALNNPLLQQLQRRANNALDNSILPAVFLPIPTLLGELWDGLLKAVPKKKTSHMKKRHRQMAGKALKDVTALNTCSSCGRQKRAHVLCEYCVKSIKQWFTNGFRTREEVENLRNEKQMDKEMELNDEKEVDNKNEDQDYPDNGDFPSPSRSRDFPTAEARPGTSNEMQWYNSQKKFLVTGQRKPRGFESESYGLIGRRGREVGAGRSNRSSASIGSGRGSARRGVEDIPNRRFVPLPDGPPEEEFQQAEQAGRGSRSAQ